MSVNRALVTSCAVALSPLGVLVNGCADCACRPDPNTCTAKAPKISDERMQHDLAMADNQVYLVTDLERHTDPDGHGYYTFTFNPHWPDYPFADTEVGRVAAADLLARRPDGVGPSGERATVILVAAGGVQQLQPMIEIGRR
ncbi:MAG: hypothetical protein JWO87_2753 [Phycisphaerales bacterium]|nr:hypothetical protein [Phycisphaerales bacterium]